MTTTTLRLVNDRDQVINYHVDLVYLDHAHLEDIAQDIYFHIRQYWGQQDWITCVVWWDDHIITGFQNWDLEDD